MSPASLDLTFIWLPHGDIECNLPGERVLHANPAGTRRQQDLWFLSGVVPWQVVSCSSLHEVSDPRATIGE
jgi:hypothetical protein